MRIIAHLDMDAFFAAIEERDQPRFKGLPVVVGADPKDGKGRGVVSTANYKAREYGIHSALPISKAWELSEIAKSQGKPKAVFVGVDFKHYEEVSEKIIEIIKKYVTLIEIASIDEVYFDLSSFKSYKKAQEVCKKIKYEIKSKEKLTASVGIGSNKLVAKIASDMQKPDGLTVVKSEDVESFFEPLSLRKIPGIGPKTEEFFKKLGVSTVKDIKKYSQEDLKSMFGKLGIDFYEKARGIDNSPIEECYDTKSIGEQETFEKDTFDSGFISERLKFLTESVWQRFKKSDFKKFRTIALTVRFQGFETKSRSYTPKENIRDLDGFRFEALKIFIPFLDRRENPNHKSIRLIGLRIKNLK
ncbi:MAG: DNA polymerase IV [Patescibacteria group bacterium]|nr:DNA polymerase IV [Patescibacteria group bacterium]